MRYLLLLSVILSVSCASKHESFYSVPDIPWPDSYGSHRAIIEIDEPADLVKLDLLWRRHDRSPEMKQFIIVNAETNDTIKNIHRLSVNNERCELVFGPVKKPGTYFFYYLPYAIQKDYGFYNKGYLRPEESSEEWVKKYQLEVPEVINKLADARVKTIQSRTEFDSFYPMEVIPTKEEKTIFLSGKDQDYLLFPESREHPIRMKDEMPLKWITAGTMNEFQGEALKNEYFAFQIGLYALNKDIENVKVEFSGLKHGESGIAADRFTCFNTGGIDPFGEPFEKRIDVNKGMVQPLWIGIDVPETIAPGVYHGSVIVQAANAEAQTIKVQLKLNNEVISDRGDSEPWRHSRLRWLNSTLGIDDEPTGIYKPIKALGNRKYDFSGKILGMAESGMPGSIEVYGTEVLQQPIKLIVETPKGSIEFSKPGEIEMLKNESGIMRGSWKSYADDLELNGIGTIEADGYIHFKVRFKAEKDITLRDVRLEIPLKNEVARYMMGMGLPGGDVPKRHDAKWEGPHDSFWIGNSQGGLWCELRGGDYHGPLLNLYHPDYPESWNNNGKGGFKIRKGQKVTNAVVYSGRRNMKEGESIEFEWALLMTPVKKINYRSQFIDRYYHRGDKPQPSKEDFEAGVKIINVHQANVYNPHINYPFIAVDEMKEFVGTMHDKGQKVKIYNTVRELTNYTTEIWALRSLGHEILGNGKGGGFPWLREHFIDGYKPQWYQYFPDKSADASIVNAPGDSRWYNYYIEGLAWLVRNVDIDGLYLDDVSYDRRIVKRMRKVLDKEKPGCIMDLHSNTGFSKGPATQYTEYFPYIDKLWFGESFQYDKMPPSNWLVEVSGIPFGLMGDMLHAGGNRWLGMLYGMTVRHPWLTEGVTCDPRPVWKVWDEFGIHEATMVGFWDDKPVVSTDSESVKATTYLKEGEALIAIGNFSDDEQTVQLKIDWKKIGLDPSKAKLYAPGVKDFQDAHSFKLHDEISIEPRKGWILMVTGK